MCRKTSIFYSQVNKCHNQQMNKKKNELWKEITKAVNAVGRANRSVQEVKDKWKNLHSVVKKEFATFKRETKKSGGGPAPKQPSQASEKIIAILEDTAGFSGLKGFEIDSRSSRSMSTKNAIDSRPK